MPIPPRDNCGCGADPECCPDIAIVDSDGHELEVNPDGSINVNTTVNFPPSVDVVVTNEVEIKNDSGDPITVDGTVCIDDCGGSITVDDGGVSLTVDGTVDIGNFPASVEVSNDVGNPLPISKNTTVNSVTNPVFTQLTDGVIAVDVQNAGAATGALMVQLAGDAQIVDISAWTPFVDMFVMAGGVFSGSSLGGAAAIATSTRAWLVTWVNAAGAAFGTNAVPVQIGDAGGSITVDDGGGSLTVDGTVAVSNFPASIEVSNDVGNPLPVSGTVTITDGSGPVTVDGTVCIDDCGGSITVDDGGGSLTVDGTVAVSNFPASVEVSNDVGNPLPISDAGGSITVDGTVVSSEAKAEDSVSASGDNGIPVLGVRNDTNATTTSTDGDYSFLATDEKGNVKTASKAGTATLANVSASASSVTLIAANDFRKGAVIHNDSLNILYVKFGSTASATSYTYRLTSQATLELPVMTYTGIITGIWTVATGAARTTELT